MHTYLTQHVVKRRIDIIGTLRMVVKDFYWQDRVILECGHEVPRGRMVKNKSGDGCAYVLPRRKHCPNCKES
jgi:hypothetical protein